MLARDSGWAVLGRPARYVVVSVLAGGLAQGGLALAYGVLGWDTAAATLLSLAVSIGPSYWGSRTYVWAGRGSRQRRREATAFAVVAVVGSLTAIALTALAELVGSLLTEDRGLLTGWVCGGSVAATGLVWVARYAVLDRLIFVVPPSTDSTRTRGAPIMLPSQSSPPAAPRGPEQDLDVSIVLPTLNEEQSVGLCVTEAHEALAEAGLTGEVVVVDNGCTDRSAEVAQTAGARVVQEPVPGYGAAILGGIRAARGRVVVMADADCTYPLDRVGELVRPVLDGDTDLCIGSRLSAATRHSMPFLHRFVGTPTLTLLVRQGGGYAQLTDSQSGYRAFRREAIAGLALRSTGMEFASEMLLRASQAGWAVREVPLGYRERVGESKLSTWSDGMRHLRLIIKLTPYQLLWLPGIALTAMAGALYVLGIVAPEGLGVGSLTWQPVFFASICLVLGVTASLAASVLGYHLPSSAETVRHRFRFVGSPLFPQRVAGAGLIVAGSGLLLDGGLLAAWIAGAGSPALRLTFAGLAQGAILTGAIIAVFALLYRLLLDLEQVPAPARAAGTCASCPEHPATAKAPG